MECLDTWVRISQPGLPALADDIFRKLSGGLYIRPCLISSCWFWPSIPSYVNHSNLNMSCSALTIPAAGHLESFYFSTKSLTKTLSKGGPGTEPCGCPWRLPSGKTCVPKCAATCGPGVQPAECISPKIFMTQVTWLRNPNVLLAHERAQLVSLARSSGGCRLRGVWCEWLASRSPIPQLPQDPTCPGLACRWDRRAQGREEVSQVRGERKR